MQLKLLKYVLDIESVIEEIEPEMLWGIIQKNIPVLADEIRKIKGA